MIVPFVDLKQQYFSLKHEIDSALSEVIMNSDFIRGKHMVPFEEEFSNAIGIKHTISCANGTDALYIAMKALGVSYGDEVITTAHTWISTSETITQAGGKVVFCDTDRRTFNINFESIREKITPKTKGIIVVHMCGQPADVHKVKKLADELGLWVIEDCAQAHLASIAGRNVGTYGDIATFSFYPGKNLGAMGDAGAVVTNSDDLANWMRLFARHGGKGNHRIEGINSRLDGIQAAILRVKLPHLEQWTLARQQAAKVYDELLNGLAGVETPFVDVNRRHVYHLYMIKVDGRDRLQKYLQEKGIGTGVNYPRALPFYEAYKRLNHSPNDFPNAYYNQSRILSLPIFAEITRAQQEYVAEEIANALNAV